LSWRGARRRRLVDERLEVAEPVHGSASDEHARQGPALHQSPDGSPRARQKRGGGCLVDDQWPIGSVAVASGRTRRQAAAWRL
jgi:hypothetical protein